MDETFQYDDSNPNGLVKLFLSFMSFHFHLNYLLNVK